MAIMGKKLSDTGELEKLIKIGELAETAGKKVSIVRFWTKIGLLEIADIISSFDTKLLKVIAKSLYIIIND